MSKDKKILPVEGERNILITSALPYVNNVPHLGNVIGSVLSADVFARYAKSRGYNCLFVCGTDEYGTATETKAIEEGVTPKELCDKFYKVHKGVYDWFNIGFDHFGRTSTPQQTTITQDIFMKLYKNGYLEEKTTNQPYCPVHNSFLADRFVEGECPLCHYPDARGDQCDKCGHVLDPLELINPKCKLDGATPVVKETTHMFLCLDKLQPAEEEWFKKASKEGRWSSNGVQITSSWLKEGLHPRGITRDLKWGTPIPSELGKAYEDKVCYVWFDACIGYVSITATYTDEWEKWWRNPEHVKLYQFMGKDNVPFHTVVFPSTQIGTKDKWTMLNTISTTEYLNYEKGKFSKSRGIGVFGTDAEKTKIPSDVWRYYLLSHRPETSDSEFEWEGFIAANNNELLKNLGNFVNRVIKFVNSKIYDSKVPDYNKFNDHYFDEHRRKVNETLKQYIDELEDVKLRAGLSTALHISSLGNTLLQDNKLDNKLATEQPDRCAAVVGLALSHIHLLASLIAPYMPKTSESILAQLNAEFLTIPDKWESNTIPVGRTIGKAAYLFSQIKPEMEQKWREEFGGAEARKAKEEAAAKAAAKKAEKERKKKAKAAKKIEQGTVEAAEKGGPEAVKTVEEEVAEGVHQVSLQSS
ncbi:methionyl-tRNA synthetase [Sporormia fimetaria CBS 119925]|uniref:methionine--tRNA ligase n=1 Tax=Sporormia fimetaria CBS 119925 TaxID=1340428 RepID=A0A6A6V6M9_9PLEO|nr:methionyl-tRNA synthetase [Sporormia fimetaria CBS 119925]